MILAADDRSCCWKVSKMLSWARYENKPAERTYRIKDAEIQIVSRPRNDAISSLAELTACGNSLVEQKLEDMWSAEEDAKAAVEHSKPHQNGGPTVALDLVGT